jgi:hypothetical protein
MTTFYRGAFNQMWLEIRSNESLGILDTDYVEDYNGVDGQLSLYHVATAERFTVPMMAVASETPDVPNDFFRGVQNLSALPNGTYQVQGRVRDEVGNYSVLGAVAAPFGTERVLALELQVLDGFSTRHTVTAGPLTVRAATAVPRRTARRETTIQLGSQ